MFSLSSLLNLGPQPSRERIDLALQQCQAYGRSSRMRGRQLSADDHLYFAVRSFCSSGMRHVVQYAFADDRGNVVLSAFGHAQSNTGALYEPPEDLPVDPLDPEALEYLLTRVCNGATLVAFGKILQAGLLPAQAVGGAFSVECAWRRFLRLGRERRCAFSRGEPMTLSDALEAAGLEPLRSEDASVKALAIRDLWAWMDRLG